MSTKIKTAIGLYIFSILLFSGLSKAQAFNDLANFDVGFENSTGTVFELNGYLYFASKNSEALLVHSSNFSFFEGLELPVEIQASSVIVSINSGFSSNLRTIRFITNTIKNGASL